MNNEQKEMWRKLSTVPCSDISPSGIMWLPPKKNLLDLTATYSNPNIGDAVYIESDSSLMIYCNGQWELLG